MKALTWVRERVAALMALRDRINNQEDPDNIFAAAALERHKREGMRLAIRARWVAMAMIAVMVPFINPGYSVIFYEALILGFIVIGWLQQKAAEVGRSRREFLLIFADLVLLAVTVTAPNPFSDADMPTAMQFRDNGFIYFFLLLAFATLAYSWRTVWAIGVLASAVWGASVLIVWAFGARDPALTESVAALFGENSPMAFVLDPNRLLGFVRVQEIVVLLLVAAILATTARRSRVLLMEQAALARERANLARYFSPNVVEELSHNDEPLKQVRTQDVAVMFVDIVGFTRFAASRPSEDVIGALRAFHQRMETEVFRHEGTLDKYLGDGLMATFGTPFAGPRDAANALSCAKAMMAAMEAWNAERRAAGEPEIRASFGLHYGPAVLGDIGANRLEFAVIGNTVNVASRVEALTRALGVELAVTEALRAKAEAEAGGELIAGMTRHEHQRLRGLEDDMTVWTLCNGAPAIDAAPRA